MARLDSVSIGVFFRRFEKSFCGTDSEEDGRQNFHFVIFFLVEKREKVFEIYKERDFYRISALGRVYKVKRALAQRGGRERGGSGERELS